MTTSCKIRGVVFENSRSQRDLKGAYVPVPITVQYPVPYYRVGMSFLKVVERRENKGGGGVVIKATQGFYPRLRLLGSTGPFPLALRG